MIAGATALALAVAGCSSSSKNTPNANSSGSGSTSSSKPSGTLIYGEAVDFPENFMPLISAGNSTAVGDIEVRILDGAYRVTPQITFVSDPDQITEATSTMVNGQQVVDMKINPKAVWADGQPITAADYVFTWTDQKSSDPKTGGCTSLLSTVGWNQIESATAVSTTEVKYTFIKGQPFSDWQGLISGTNAPILSKHIFDVGTPAQNCAYITKGWPTADGIPLGAQNGPWLLQKTGIDVTDKVVTLTPNPKYWGAAPKLARLVYDNIGSVADTNVKAIQNNEVNMIYPQPQLDLVSNLKKLPDVTTEINFGANFEHFDFNVKDPLLAHKEIRQAIAYGIDRKALVASTVGQFSSQASVLGNRLLVTNQKGYVDNSGDYATQNVAKAKSLLEGIGAKLGSDGYYSLNGKELAFTVITTQNNPLRDNTITIAAQQLKTIGIKLTEKADADIFAGPDKPDSLAAEGFQIALFAWVGTPSISSNNSIYQSPSVAGANSQNYSQGGDKAVDAELTKVATATTSDDEIAAANAADKLLWGDMFTLPLYQKPTLIAFDNKYTGIADNPTQAGPLWNSDSWTLSK